MTDNIDVESWPPVGRGPTEQELADGVAIVHDDGTVSWSPLVNDDDWTDEDEMRASGHPAAQAADYSEEPDERDLWTGNDTVTWDNEEDYRR